MSPSVPALEVVDLTVLRDSRAMVQNVTLTIRAGEATGLWGPNGAGKTTLFEGLVGLLPVEGTVRVANQDVTGRSPTDCARSGLVLSPSDRGIFPSLSVRENLMAASLILPIPSQRRAQVEAVLSMIPSLAPFLDAEARTLSGGQARLLALGRAVSTRPKVLILDEPATGLAPKAIESLVSVICHIREAGVGVLIAEQNPRVLNETVGAVALIRSGRIDRVGPPEEMLHDELESVR